jgi:pimeloyl-ACP methyl ester carboxylesterase
MVSAAGMRDRATFAWERQGRSIKVVYETLDSTGDPTGHASGTNCPGGKADGRPVLLLRAFSTVSIREDMRTLAGRLAAHGFRCILADWPGFGDSTRGRLNYGPQLYHSLLADFAAMAVPPGAAVVAAGHAAAYVLALARDRPGVWSRVVLAST